MKFIKRKQDQEKVHPALVNVEKKKIVTYLGKKHEKKVINFSGFIAKFKQALKNHDSYFVYFANQKLLAFLELLQRHGLIHFFFIVPKKAQEKITMIPLSQDFDSRILVVYLRQSTKHGPALRDIKVISVPSRRISVKYEQLMAQNLKMGIFGLYVLNTSQGLLTHTEALQKGIGGELVCEIV